MASALYARYIKEIMHDDLTRVNKLISIGSNGIYGWAGGGHHMVAR